MEILALEASTTSAKAMLYHTDSDSFEVAARPYRGQQDKAARNAEEMFSQVAELGRELAEGKRVDCIALSSIWHSVVACDRGLLPLSPALLWDFTGTSELCRALRQDRDYASAYYHRTGCMVNVTYPAFMIRWLTERRPELLEANYLSLGSYLTWRLTGRWATTRCLVSGSGLLNIQTGGYDEETLRDLKLRPSQFGDLIDSDETFPLSPEGARLLGLRPGIPVLPTNSDGGLNQVGVGALREGIATLSVGTSGAIRLTTAAPAIPETPSTWCYRSPNSWLSGGATNGCCNCVDWAREKLFPPGTTYDEMEQGVSDGVTTPVFLPFLFGERCPGWDDRRTGGFSGCLPGHNLQDLYLAVQEGVLFNLYQCYLALAEVVERPREIKLSGGILHSRRWTQMCADIFGHTLTLDRAEHGSLLGASVLAMERMGVIGDVRDYIPAPAGTVEPDPAAMELYQEKYRRYLEQYHKQA